MRRLPLSPPALLFALLIVLATAGPYRAADVPGGITDAEGRVGFLATPKGGIDAVNLATGEILWQTAAAQRPLCVVGNRLYAVAAVEKKRPLYYMGFLMLKPPPGKHGFRIVGFDLDDKGQRVLESEVVETPEWVQLPEPAGEAFTTRWQIDKDGLLLTWEARTWYSGGRKPTPEMVATARRQAGSAFRMDLRTGETRPATPSKPSVPPAWPFANDLENLAVRWQGFCGSTYKAVILEEADGKQKLVLRSWDAVTHAAQPAKELAQGRQLVVLPAMDDRFLGVREILPSPEKTLNEEERRRYAWAIFAVETGAYVGSMPYDPHTQTMNVINERAYLLIGGSIVGALDQPFRYMRSVRAVDLKTGKTLWEHPIPSKAVAPLAK
jgi:hypothetical protein